MTESVCVTCEELFPNIKLYHCQRCFEKQDEAVSVDYLCEDGLISHIKKGRSVVDSHSGNKTIDMF